MESIEKRLQCWTQDVVGLSMPLAISPQLVYEGHVFTCDLANTCALWVYKKPHPLQSLHSYFTPN